MGHTKNFTKQILLSRGETRKQPPSVHHDFFKTRLKNLQSSKIFHLKHIFILYWAECWDFFFHIGLGRDFLWPSKLSCIYPGRGHRVKKETENSGICGSFEQVVIQRTAQGFSKNFNTISYSWPFKNIIILYKGNLTWILDE